jgi:DNA-binding HxlR family transcriptional regulator
MGRPSIIKPAIVKVLSKSANPMRFGELKHNVIRVLNRKKLDDKQFDTNLQRLREDGIVKKTLFNGKIAYTLTSGYYEQQLKSYLIKLLNERNLSQLYDRLEGEDLPPFIVFLEPPAYDYSTKSPLREKDQASKYHSFGGGPMTKQGDFRIIPDWENPSKSIASVMLNDFLGLLSTEEKRNITELVRWAYWAGCRKEIEQMFNTTLLDRINENRNFALECIEKFKQNAERVKTEKNLLTILEITEELIKKDNLADFLSYLSEKQGEHRRLLGEILCHHGPLSAGERIFSHFLDFGEKIISGLSYAGLLHDNLPLNNIPINERFILSSTRVWDEFFGDILYGFVPIHEEIKKDSELNKIGGTYDDAIDVVSKMKGSLQPLLELPSKRQMVFVYLWGFPETFLLSHKSVIRSFDDWQIALRDGQLDHRVWLFTEKMFARVAKAYNAIKRGRTPLDVRIDKEQWSLQDLYLLHPFGKDVNFWEQLITDLKNRTATKRKVYGGGPVPKKVYEAFKKKETQFVEKMLDDEESKANRQRRK